MRFFLNLKLNTKMLAGFIIVGVILFFGTAVGVFSTYSYKEQLGYMYTRQVTPALAAADFFDQAQKVDQMLLSLAQDSTRLASDSPQIKQSNQQANTYLQVVEKSSPASLSRSISDLRTSWDRFRQDSDAALSNWQTSSFKSTDLALLQQDWDKLVGMHDIYDRQLALEASQLYQSGIGNFTWVAVGLASAGSIGITIAILIGLFVSSTISTPVKRLAAEMQHLSRGDVRSASQLHQISGRKDEIGDLAHDFQNLRAYLEKLAKEADHIASGNLLGQGSSQGDQDVLSNALNQMVEQLRMLVMQMQSSSGKVNQSARQLAQTAGKTTRASSQMTQTIESMADGIIHQTEDMRKTTQALQQAHSDLSAVVKSAHHQEDGLSETLRISNQMDQSIRQMLSLVNDVTLRAGNSAEQARDGASILHKTLASMEEIRSQVNQLGDRVNVMGDHSVKIGEILETIEEIATKTNILAINAAIEAAHAETQAKSMTEDILGEMMLAQCMLINHLIMRDGGELNTETWKKICAESGFDTIMITDADGVTTQTNEAELVGWRFPDDPKTQAYPFRQLLNQRDGKFCQESQERTFDHRVYKYAGVSRSDQAGIIQVGLNMRTMQKYNLQIHGFAVVANEVYQLAEHARTSTHEIRDLIRTIQASIREAQVAKQNSQNEVNDGIGSAGEARKAFDLISTSVIEVLQLAQQAQQSSTQMELLSKKMVSVLNTFQQIVEENSSSTQHMMGSFQTISSAIESAAQLSAKNTQSVQEVLSTNNAMRTQMDDVVTSSDTLTRMADELQDTVQKFRLH